MRIEKISLLNYSRQNYVSHKGVDIVNAKTSVKEPIRILISDIDGTLLTQDFKLPSKTLTAIRNLINAQVPLILATGRGYKSIDVLFKKFEMEPDYAITESGAVVIDKYKNKLYQNTLSSEHTEKIIKVARDLKMQDSFRLSFDGDSYMEGSAKGFEGTGIKINEINSFEEMLDKGYLPTRAIFANMNSKSFAEIEPIRKYIDSIFGNELSVFISGYRFCEVTNKSVSKALGIKVLKDFLGTEFENMACIGDAENDLSMARLLTENGGMSISMGNGIQEMKNTCRFITDDIHQCGFHRAAETIIDINKKFA